MRRRFNILPALSVVAVVTSADACGSARLPARIVVGDLDTVIVHSRHPTPITVLALNADGDTIPAIGMSYRRTGGDSIAISPDGLVTCTKGADAIVLVSVGAVSTSAVVRCRPVQRIELAGPVQFLLGDTAQRLPARVIGMDGKVLDVVAGTVAIADRSVAGAKGMRISARSPGVTTLTLTVGDESATVGLDVYQPLDALVHLRPEQRYVAVSLGLRSGEARTWTLPAGTWMLTMLPYSDERKGLRLRVDGATCVPVPLSPRRITCQMDGDATVTVSHPSKVPAPELTGQLLAQRLQVQATSPSPSTRP